MFRQTSGRALCALQSFEGCLRASSGSLNSICHSSSAATKSFSSDSTGPAVEPQTCPGGTRPRARAWTTSDGSLPRQLALNAGKCGCYVWGDRGGSQREFSAAQSPDQALDNNNKEVGKEQNQQQQLQKQQERQQKGRKKPLDKQKQRAKEEEEKKKQQHAVTFAVASAHYMGKIFKEAGGGE